MIYCIHWLLLLLSALLYALPFFCIPKLWWSIFVFPVPLFWVCMHQKMHFIHGFMWGLILFGVHLVGTFSYLLTLSQDTLFTRCMPIICALTYFPLLSGLCFWFTQHVINVCINHMQSYLLMAWLIAIYKYLYILENISLWPFGQSEGYPLLNPLIPLTAYPASLSLVYILGSQTVILVLLATAASIVWLIVSKTVRALIICSTCISFWLISIALYYPINDSIPTWLDTVVALPEVFLNNDSPFKARNQAIVTLSRLIKKFPQVTVVITPESAFYAHQLQDTEIHSLFDCTHLGKNIHILMGSFRWDNGQYYNCLYWINNGTIKYSFKKRHAMLLTERIPAFFNQSDIKQHYFTSTPPITISTEKRPLFEITNQIVLVPYLCSELFFNTEADDFYPFDSLVAICNDRWCWHYFAEIMHHAARLKAITWQRPILYISFYHHTYCSLNGQSIPLQSYTAN